MKKQLCTLSYPFFLDSTGESGDREAKRVRGRLRRLPFYSGDLSEAPEKKGRGDLAAGVNRLGSLDSI